MLCCGVEPLAAPPHCFRAGVVIGASSAVLSRCSFCSVCSCLAVLCLSACLGAFGFGCLSYARNSSMCAIFVFLSSYLSRRIPTCQPHPSGLGVEMLCAVAFYAVSELQTLVAFAAQRKRSDRSYILCRLLVFRFQVERSLIVLLGMRLQSIVFAWQKCACVMQLNWHRASR